MRFSSAPALCAALLSTASLVNAQTRGPPPGNFGSCYKGDKHFADKSTEKACAIFAQKTGASVQYAEGFDPQPGINTAWYACLGADADPEAWIKTCESMSRIGQVCYQDSKSKTGITCVYGNG